MQLVATFDNVRRCSTRSVALDLEGVVAKRECDPYRPGERLWVKAKNRNTARFAAERAGAGRRIAASAPR